MRASTASPTESEHRHYANAIGGAGNKGTTVCEGGSRLLKEYDDNGYNRTFNRQFTILIVMRLF
jgi:hypothetical protein